MLVREATLDDVTEIVGVHVTNPDRPLPESSDDMSIAERCSHGGPWMSVESCAIHTNNMLAWGYVPLVVEDRGRVIAEAEFYVGGDVPPLGRTLDISVLYVRRDCQGRGAGTLLMEEMLSRAREAGCDHITVSGPSPSQGFYERFGFNRLLDLSTITCPLTGWRNSAGHEGWVPGDFEVAPSSTMWVGRSLSPTQKWLEVHDQLKKREPMLGNGADRSMPVGIKCPTAEGGDLVAYVVSEWGDPGKGDAYLWSGSATEECFARVLALASEAGYEQLCLLCHPQAERTAARVCGSEPKGKWPIYGMKL